MKIKGCILGCLGSLAMAVAIVVLVFRLTAPLVQAADSFLAQLGKGQVEQAYQSTAAEFRQATTADEFAEMVRGNQLDQFQSASWSSRSFKNSQGEVSGTVRLATGKEISLKVLLLHQQGSWKVAGLRQL